MDRKKSVYIPNRFTFWNDDEEQDAYYICDNSSGKPQYISVEDGKKTLDYIRSKKIDAPLFDLWGHGVVTIQSIEGNDNIGAYLTAYLSNLSLDELDDADYRYYTTSDERKYIERTASQTKSVVKGGRLGFYPSSSRLYTPSRNCIEPTREVMTYEKAREKHGIENQHLVCRQAYEISYPDQEYTPLLVKEQYNKRIDWDTGCYNILQEKDNVMSIIAASKERIAAGDEDETDRWIIEQFENKLYELEHKAEIGRAWKKVQAESEDTEKYSVFLTDYLNENKPKT